MRSKILLCATALSALVAIPLVAAAALPMTDPDFELYEKILSGHEEIVKSWLRLGHWSMAITIVVGILGVVLPVLKGSKHRLAITASWVCGLLVTALTLVAQIVFDYDHRAYEKFATEAQHRIDRVRLWYPMKPPTDDVQSRFEWVKEMSERVISVNTWESEFRNVSKPVGAANFTLFESVYAQTWTPPRPRWLDSTPDDTNYLFFVGAGQAKSLLAGKNLAAADAAEIAAETFSRELARGGGKTNSPVEIERISSFLASQMQIPDTYYDFDEPSGEYRFWVLASLPRSVLGDYLDLYSIQWQIAVPEEVKQSVLAFRQEPTRPGLAMDQSQFLDAARKGMPDADYERFANARKLRLSGETVRALDILRNMVVEGSGQPTLVWLNLALCYDMLDSAQQAEQTYLKAIATDSLATVQNATLYNSYGVWLLRRGNRAEAADMFRKAVEVDPANVKAQENLKQATQY